MRLKILGKEMKRRIGITEQIKKNAYEYAKSINKKNLQLKCLPDFLKLNPKKHTRVMK